MSSTTACSGPEMVGYGAAGAVTLAATAIVTFLLYTGWQVKHGDAVAYRDRHQVDR